MSDEPAPRGLRKDKVSENRAYFGPAFLTTVGAPGLGPASLWGSPVLKAVSTISVSVTLCAASLYLLPPQSGTDRRRGRFTAGAFLR